MVICLCAKTERGKRSEAQDGDVHWPGTLRTAGSILAASLIVCAASAVGLGVTGWAQPTGSVAITPSFTRTNQTNSASTALMLNHDGPVTLQASEAAAGDGVLTSPSSDVLATEYRLRGAALGASADTDWVSASDFVDPSRSYSVEGVGPSEITVWVRGVTPADRVSDAGVYGATVILTVTW